MKKALVLVLLSSCQQAPTSNTVALPVSAPSTTASSKPEAPTSTPAAVIAPATQPRYQYLETTPKKSYFTVNHPDPERRAKIDKLITKSRKGNESCKPLTITTAIISFECSWTEYGDTRDAPSIDHRRGFTFDITNEEPTRVSLSMLVDGDEATVNEWYRRSSEKPTYNNFSIMADRNMVYLYHYGSGYTFEEMQPVLRSDSVISTLRDTAPLKKPE